MNKHIPIAFLLPLLLAGCGDHFHNLRQSESEEVTAGQMFHGKVEEDNRLVLERGGKRFEGILRIERTQNWQELQERYQSNRAHWRRIVSGLDKDHVINTARSELKAADGETISCEIAWTRQTKPAGSCAQGGGESFGVEFEFAPSR